jgi:hypothetical protein
MYQDPLNFIKRRHVHNLIRIDLLINKRLLCTRWRSRILAAPDSFFRAMEANS